MAEQSQFIPKGMRVMAERLGAFTRNRFKIENAGSNEAMPGQIITVTLPSNTLVDLHSLRLHGRFVPVGGGMHAKRTVDTGSGPSLKQEYNFDDNELESFSIKPVPPEDMHQLISRMTVSANGTAIQQGCMEYNTVHAIKRTLDSADPHLASTHRTITPLKLPKPATGKDDLIYQPLSSDKQSLCGPGDKIHSWPGGGRTLDSKLQDWFQPVDGSSDIAKGGQYKPQTVGKWNNHIGNVEEFKKRASSMTDAEYGVGHDVVDFQLWDWRGYISESSVRYMPTDLVGALQIQLTLSDANILPVMGRGAQGAFTQGDHKGFYGDASEGAQLNPAIKNFSYRLSNLYWTVDVLSVDGPYGDMLRGKIASNGYISLLFKEYYVFHKSGWQGDSEQHRFSLSTGCMDAIYSVIRPEDYMSKNHPISMDALNTTGRHKYTPAFNFIMPALPYHNYGRNYWTGKDKSTDTTISIAHNDRPAWHFDVNHDMTYDYKINSVMHPQFQANMQEAVWDCSYLYDQTHGEMRHGNQIASREQWWEKQAIVPCILNLTDGPLQLMSGYDSRGHSSFIEYSVRDLKPNNYHKTVGVGGVYTNATGDIAQANKFDRLSTTSVVETTAELRVGAGLSMVVAR